MILCVYIKFIDWVTGCDLVGPTMAIFKGKGQLYRNCSTHDSGCLFSPNLMLESQEISREPLVFSLQWTPEEISSSTRELNNSTE